MAGSLGRNPDNKGKTRRTKAAEPAGEGSPPGLTGASEEEKWRAIFLGAAVALLIARPLSPSEAATIGDGLPFVMLWLLLATAWGAMRCVIPGLPSRFGSPEALVLLGSAWYVVACFVNISSGPPRAMINAAWDWVGIVTGFLLIRQLLGNPREARALLAAGLGLAIGMALLGLYQYFYEFPSIRARFAHDPEGMLAQAGVYVEKGSREWTLFVNRLRSSEPLGTFALANSLAGFLVTWLVIGVGVGSYFSRRRNPGAPDCRAASGRPGAASEQATVPDTSDLPQAPAARGLSPPNQLKRVARQLFQKVIGVLRTTAKGPRGLILMLMLCVLLWVLLLTKSRSAHAALVVGIVLLVGQGLRRTSIWPGQRGRSEACKNLQRSTGAFTSATVGGRRAVRLALVYFLVAASVLASLVGLGFLVGWDWQVLAEAPKSLGYRLQYWIATLELIADRPIFGCGPGNFQVVYTRYMLPEASEVIADPHNFVLELMASAGVPAGCLFLWAILALLGSEGWRQDRRASKRAPSYPGGSPGWSGEPSEGSRNSTTQSPLQQTMSLATQESPLGVRAIAWGAVLGVGCGWIIGLFTTVPPSFIGVLCAAVGVILALWSCWPWIESGENESLLARVAATTMLVHLLASGGISFAGVAGALWMCLAVAGLKTKAPESLAWQRRLSREGKPRDPAAGTGWRSGILRFWPWAFKASKLQEIARPLSHATGQQIGRSALGISLGLMTLACYLMAYRPVMMARGYLLTAQRLSAEGRTAEALELLNRAASADPLAAEPALALAQAAWSRLLEGANGEAAKQFERWTERFVRLSGQSAKAWEGVGDLFWQGGLKLKDPQWLWKATEAYRQAALRFATNAVVRAKFARALATVGKLPEAKQEAGQALELDRRNPHPDRKIPADLRQEIQMILQR
ncbi:MAG: O-antigen ligase family protein [Thermoguttaceae bacterium]|nr:O-antigen ligase family protein [Thermoguttaceae bacterium]MDW8079838.1 O-antigen ligase family protein [Thermoguttaceae bacterium]